MTNPAPSSERTRGSQLGSQSSSGQLRRHQTALKTAVVGAGPAGLLFTFIGKLVMGRNWHVELYDKRANYARTHRLRIAREPFLAIQKQLDDQRFDALMTFLDENHFSPEVNRLEAKLGELLALLGVEKQVREITSLDGLDFDTIVGADSVHSTVARLVAHANPPSQVTFERVARLRVTGQALPARLTALDQFRLSKVLGSIVDYRVNANGFAELDLFLTDHEYARVRALDASPKTPVTLVPGLVSRLEAPLFRSIVDQLEHGGNQVTVHSTFELQHSVRSQVSFRVGQTRIFLLGDAAVSLPFFRGMACLGACAHALAQAHLSGDLDSYQTAVARIAVRELGVVRARAYLVRAARELVRVSAMLPFPIQAWWLSAARDPLPDRWSAGAYFNLFVAGAGLGVAASGLWSPWLTLATLPIEWLGGVAYRWTLSLEPGPHRHLRRIWEVQLALLAAGGILAVLTSRMPWPAAIGWWVSGAFFVLGIYTFERWLARHLTHAGLDEPT